MSSNFQLLPFPNGHEANLRARLNDGFPELNTDPIELVAQSGPKAYRSVYRILEKCGMRRRSMEAFQDCHKGEFTTIIPVNEKSPAVRFMIEQGTGNRVSVIPVSFLTKLGDQILSVAPDMTHENALHVSSRITHAYALGLLAYDLVDPWKLISNPKADSVTQKLAGSLLCTGIDDGSQGDPPKSVHNYMRATLPSRVASAIAYLDFGYALVDQGSDPDSAQSTVDKFLERRIEVVSRVVSGSALAISDIDHAFAYPLSTEDLQSFIAYASIMNDRGLVRPLKHDNT